MCLRRRVYTPAFLACVVQLALVARGETGDVENSHDYPSFPRLPGYIITDYAEDNPAEYNFPVARPIPFDSAHVEMVHAVGHRYVIQYESSAARMPTLLQIQLDYEKLATAAGFSVEKTGAVGDVAETFHRMQGGRDTWVYLEPAISVNVLTIVEASAPTPSPPSLEPPVLAPSTAPRPALASPGTSIEAGPSAESDDSLYDDLGKNGRVILPVSFLPGKAQLDPDSQPLIGNVVAMLNRHPDLCLRIEGHTDSTGDPDADMSLSALRAFAVQDTLITEHIDKERLDAVGVGGLQPIASNSTAQGREKNRRIELVVRKIHPKFHPPAPNGQNYYPTGAANNGGGE